MERASAIVGLLLLVVVGAAASLNASAAYPTQLGKPVLEPELAKPRTEGTIPGVRLGGPDSPVKAIVGHALKSDVSPPLRDIQPLRAVPRADGEVRYHDAGRTVDLVKQSVDTVGQRLCG